MNPKECKRLAEVDFPIVVVSRHSAREQYTAQALLPPVISTEAERSLHWNCFLLLLSLRPC